MLRGLGFGIAASKTGDRRKRIARLKCSQALEGIMSGFSFERRKCAKMTRGSEKIHEGSL
jgi:hypothetical protein